MFVCLGFFSSYLEGILVLRVNDFSIFFGYSKLIEKSPEISSFFSNLANNVCSSFGIQHDF